MFEQEPMMVLSSDIYDSWSYVISVSDSKLALLEVPLLLASLLIQRNVCQTSYVSLKIL